MVYILSSLPSLFLIVDGGWSSWHAVSGPEGECPQDCGIHTHMVERNCSDPIPHNGGQNCSGPVNTMQTCFIHSDLDCWGRCTLSTVYSERNTHLILNFFVAPPGGGGPKFT